MRVSEDRRRVALVTTTIHVPRCLEGYLENAERHGHAERLAVVVVGDRKSPLETGVFLGELRARFPSEVVWLDIEAQRDYLRRWPALDLVIRHDCIQRRNVGYLWAVDHGAEVVISADDDNFVTEEDYVGAHLTAGTTRDVPVVSHPSGWWNVCERLVCEPPRRFYHRGYPRSLRTWETGGHEVRSGPVKVAVNAGLWLDAPDVDATTNSEEPFEVVAMADVDGRRSCALAAGTWCPFNSQNTSFHAGALPAMYLVVMLDVVRGRRIGRMDDIWMSYFVRAIGDRLGESVVYGPPLVSQQRNPHDITGDLEEELTGYRITEWLVAELRRLRVAERTWAGAYLELIHHLRDAAETSGLDRPEQEYLRHVLVGMATWHAVATELVSS
jgi:hypothetical protein